ncbi:L-aspartate oxidase [Gryllotalpicola protaetiae]|uniref:L-aspartate oxidase n=1 Tax=Gryllotalpicola protaetiae TaxID=2419771 RepID=A0A387BRX2_9MICO|nr:L-aspartate oxidase [Gryllotalpicola protaetiae]AYG03810.1 L-aspartate oxidase [Gryllotalpicola protaetiae]
MRVIVVGSGLAGLLTAREAVDAGAEVLLVTKGALADANTTHAQGGIAAALWADDSVAAHVADTMAAGAGLCDRAAVEVLCAEGPDRVRELIRLGVRFDRAGGGLARGLEAAHSAPRILHAGGDATGAEIERALIAAVVGEGRRVEVREHTALAELVIDDGRVVGVELGDGTIEVADAVVLATGGAGRLYAHTTNPAVATGDGVAAAWRAGAELADAEFYQFHPTALAAPGSFLISEAVRGEGAVLRNARGERFMLDVHPDAELAPRDVVARGIATEMAAQGGEPVVLDATSLGASALARRFPTIDRATRAAGFAWGREPIPVTPAAHYWMGGIATDASGRTSLPGLWAVGECASTGVHGANRLASNSLLEAAVFAHRAAQDFMRPVVENSPSGAQTGDKVTTEATGLVTGRQKVASASAGGRRSDDRGDGAFDRIALQELMWQHAGVQRSGEGLAHAASVLAAWSTTELEDRNLLDLARVVVDAALAREESRGAHYRTDFPTARPEFAQRRRRAREGAPVC